MIELDILEFVQLENKLGRIREQSIPFASRSAVNGTAFELRKHWQKEIREKMVTRNRFTVQSIRVEQTKTLNMREQFAVVGSVAPYMDEQEHGDTKVKTGSEGVAIATSYSAGQEGNRPRTRLPRKANKLASIQLNRKRVMTGNRKRKNAMLVKQAAKSGNRYVFLDLGRRKGIFRVLGRKKNIRVKMVHDLSKSSVRIPRNPTLGPAIDSTNKIAPKIYAKALQFQLNRLLR